MLDVMHPVLEIDGEEYVADTTKILASIPPKYTLYSLRDRAVKFLETFIVGTTIAKRHMTTGELYFFLNPHTVTVTSNEFRGLVSDSGSYIVDTPKQEYTSLNQTGGPRTSAEPVLGLEELFYKECDLKELIEEIVESHAELLQRLSKLEWENKRFKEELGKK